MRASWISRYRSGAGCCWPVRQLFTGFFWLLFLPEEEDRTAFFLAAAFVAPPDFLREALETGAVAAVRPARSADNTIGRADFNTRQLQASIGAVVG